MDAIRGVEHFQTDKITRVIIIKNDTRFIFVAFGHGHRAKSDGEAVGFRTGFGFNGWFLRLRVRKQRVAFSGGKSAGCL